MVQEQTPTFRIGPIVFDVTTCAMVLLTCVIVFALVFIGSRNLKMKPTGKQNALEWLIDFVRNILSGSMKKDNITDYHLLGLVMFLFVLVANLIGLVTKIEINPGEYSLWKSPTADPMVTLALAFTMTIVSNYFGVRKFGLKGYIKNTFLSPVNFLLPIKILEEFTNTLTLGLRLYGNIYAGEVLLTLIAKFALSFGIVTFIVALPLQMIWQGFSIFIGGIQAFIFVTLSMVYLSHKVEAE